MVKEAVEHRGDGGRVAEDLVEKVVEAIQKAARTDKIGDGKIFVSRLDRAVRIRTGELDENAI